MPGIPDSLAPNDKDNKDSVGLIRWHTISYRTLALWVLGILVVAAVVVTMLYPQWYATAVQLLSGSQGPASSAAGTAVRQARFTNLEGSVRVRKANQVQWRPADVSMDLEEGDTVQTLRDGMARIAFTDGTLYVVSPDTLIVLQQTDMQNHPLSNVAVKVTSGVVDLSTAQGAAGSHVLFANAEARIHQESRAMVSNNPQTNMHRITVSKGGATVKRGTEQVELAQYEQATFAGPGSPLVKTKVIAPPILLTPTNQAPIVMVNSRPAEVEFTWSAVPGADSYRLRVSNSPLFLNLVYDRRVRSTSVRLPSFKQGDYYWTVTSIGAGQKESQTTEPNRFSVIRQANKGELPLVIDKLIQHGRAIEVVGRTEPGATVLVNNEPVFNIAPNGTFKHFTAPLPNTGPNLITITAQDRKGKVATLRETVTIQ